MGKIITDTSTYSFHQIQKGAWNEPDHTIHQALTFCQQWLSGQETFELSTSGSTGIPKTIQVTRKQMEASAKATREFFNIGKESTLLCCINTWMIGGKMMLVRGMEWDATCYLTAAKENPLLDKNFGPIDFAAMVPLQVAAVLQNPSTLETAKRIKKLIIGGAPSSSILREKIAVSQLNAFQTYGMTETVSHVALAPLNEEDLHYTLLPGIEMGQDTRNCLWVKGDVTKGAKIQTNDTVTILNRQQFQWLGRADFTINSGGIKIQPELVEDKIRGCVAEHASTPDFFVAGQEDEKLGQKVVLCIACPVLSKQQEEKLLECIRTKINRYHIPKAIYNLPDFVWTDSGKINRVATLQKLDNSQKL